MKKYEILEQVLSDIYINNDEFKQIFLNFSLKCWEYFGDFDDGPITAGRLSSLWDDIYCPDDIQQTPNFIKYQPDMVINTHVFAFIAERAGIDGPMEEYEIFIYTTLEDDEILGYCVVIC